MFQKLVKDPIITGAVVVSKCSPLSLVCLPFVCMRITCSHLTGNHLWLNPDPSCWHQYFWHPNWLMPSGAPLLGLHSAAVHHHILDMEGLLLLWETQV